MDKSARIYIAGHRGLVGFTLMRRLQAGGYANIITRTHAELGLTDQRAVREFFDKEQPEYIFLAAAKVDGIHANNTYLPLTLSIRTWLSRPTSFTNRGGQG